MTTFITCPLYENAMSPARSDKPFIVWHKKNFSREDFSQEVLSYGESEHLVQRFMRVLFCKTKKRKQVDVMIAIAIPPAQDVNPLLLLLLLACYRLQYCTLLYNQSLSKKQIRALKKNYSISKWWNEKKQNKWSLAKLKKQAVLVNANMKINVDVPSHVLFTSGSTVSSSSFSKTFLVGKAVVFCLQNHLESANYSNQHLNFCANNRWLLSLPLFHVSGLSILFRVLASGACICLPPKNFQAKTVLLNTLQQSSITHLSLVTTQLQRLLQPPNEDALKILAKLKAILLGGSAIPKEQWQLTSKLPLHPTYGMTEASSQIATFHLKAARMLQKQSSIKDAHTFYLPLLPHYRAKTVNGEIYLKSRSIALYYLQLETVSHRFLHRIKVKKTIVPIVDKKHWFATGDLGEVFSLPLSKTTAKSKIKKGDEALTFVRVRGRVDNQFICGGENIYPEEIEAMLVNHLKDKQQSVKSAFVLPHPHDDWGNVIIALLAIDRFVISGENFFSNKKDNHQLLKPLSLSTTHRYQKIVRRHLEPYKIPKLFYSFKVNQFIFHDLSHKQLRKRLLQLIRQKNMTHSINTRLKY